MRYAIALTTGSSSEFVKAVLKAHSLYAYFDMIVTGDDFRSSKPDPECYVITLKKLGLFPEEVIVIEDSVAGIKAAKSSGCKVFAVDTYFNADKLSEADHIFKNHIDLLRYLKEHQNG